MPDEEEDEPINDGQPRWPRIFQKLLADTTQYVKVCTLPSDTRFWKFYLVGSTGAAPPDIFVRGAFNEEPGDDGWFPIFNGSEPSWRRGLAKHIFARPFTAPGGGSQDLVIVEAWCTKMPAELTDKEKSRLGKIGQRQK